MLRSQQQSLSSLVNFSWYISNRCSFFFFSHLQSNFCYLQCNLFPFTIPMLSFISAELSRFYPTSDFMYVFTSRRRGCQSNGPFWLSIYQPPAPSSGDGERPSRGHKASCSHSEKPHCCSFLITHEPWVCATRLSLRSKVRYYGGCFYLFISRPQPCENIIKVCYGKYVHSYGTSYISDLFAHLQRNLSPLWCPMTAWEDSIIYSESRNLCKRRNETNNHRGWMNSLLFAPRTSQTSAGERKNTAKVLIDNTKYIVKVETKMFIHIWNKTFCHVNSRIKHTLKVSSKTTLLKGFLEIQSICLSAEELINNWFYSWLVLKGNIQFLFFFLKKSLYHSYVSFQHCGTGVKSILLCHLDNCTPAWFPVSKGQLRILQTAKNGAARLEQTLLVCTIIFHG